jgi:hypothetical protein
MPSNIERYKSDLDTLINKGNDLFNAIQAECFPIEFAKQLEDKFGEIEKKHLKSLPSVKDSYQPWYSEARILIKQLLPDRLADFVRHYEKAKTRREITFENYTLEDYLQGIHVTRFNGTEKIVGPSAAIPKFRQQLAILQSVTGRFESSLFDIRQLVQADVFDSELDAAKELARNGFARAAGALAGVVLERHLSQVCDNRGIHISKKNPTISDLNDALKNASVLDLPQWRFIQHLGDIRNLCDHSKAAEPTNEQANDLVDGVLKITKTLY